MNSANTTVTQKEGFYKSNYVLDVIRECPLTCHVLVNDSYPSPLPKSCHKIQADDRQKEVRAPCLNRVREGANLTPSGSDSPG